MRLALSTLIMLLIGTTAAPQAATELAGIAHVAFRVNDVARSREFYRKLGFEQSFEFADPGKPPVSYMKVNDRQFIELYGRTDNSQALRLMHVCYEVEDIEALVREYTKRGLSPPPARKARAGNLLFVIRDPEEQVVEYTQYMPGSLHFEDRGKHLGEHRIWQHLLAVGMPVRDVASERAFYISKLGFENIGGDSDADSLRLPGRSGEAIHLDPETREAKATIVFGVANLQNASEELKARGITVREGRSENHSVSVVDPDGTIVVFTQRD